MTLTPEHLESLVVSEDFHVFPGTTMTVCCLTLKNGFAVTGDSACINPEDFDETIGREVARSEAISKVWQLEGYLLKQSA